MEAIIIYDNKKDRDLLNLINLKNSIFIKYIDYNTTEGKKEARKIKSHWGAIKNPFVIIQNEDKIIKIFYSEKNNAINQLISYLNDCKD